MANQILDKCTVYYDAKNKRIEIVHPRLSTLVVVDMTNTPIDRALKGWSQQEADAMLVMGYAVEHFPGKEE